MPKTSRKSTGKLSHIDREGRAAMVDVSDKPATQREAAASGCVYLKKETMEMIADNKIAKGNVFETARLAGIMAAKKTGELVPLCHPLNLTSVRIDIKADRNKGRIEIESRVRCSGQTGVEMEALTAVSVAALTVYDMCKAVDKGMVISDIMLLEKRGGKSGEWKRK
jgi:cyclic pyranopterin phosphate synthase